MEPETLEMIQEGRDLADRCQAPYEEPLRDPLGWLLQKTLGRLLPHLVEPFDDCGTEGA